MSSSLEPTDRADALMAYDEDLANRIRELVLMEQGVTEQRMFGGLAFLINGNMERWVARGIGYARSLPSKGSRQR